MSNFVPREYLRELLVFTTTRIRFPTTNGIPGTDQVANQLTGAFLQPFDRLIEDENHTVGERPVQQTRIAVEILRKYLEPLQVSTASVERQYLLRAYQVFLINLGTSYDELRIVRAAGDDELEQARESLAGRLGIDRAERLDELFFEPDELTEEKLESLFGLVATARDPFENPPAQPALLKWRADHLRMLWKAQPSVMQSGTSVVLPVIDPDLIPERMIIDPDQIDTTNFVDSAIVDTGVRRAAIDLWRSRAQELADMVTAVQTEIGEATASEPNLLAAYDRVIEKFLGAEDLEAALESRTEGPLDSHEDENSSLQSLDLSALRRLVRLRKLAVSGTLTEAEWVDTRAILVQFTKQQRFPTWHAEEEEKGVFLSPDFFVLPDRTAPPPLPPWRATRQARLSWENELRARFEQMQTIIQALQAAIGVTESVALLELREELIAALAEHVGQPDPAVLADKLTNRLLFDFRTTGGRKTTRVEQAIETLQGLFFILRMERSIDEDLPDDNPAEDWRLAVGALKIVPGEYSETDFDQDWQWMGTHETRRAAEFVKDHPENYLMPGLRNKQETDLAGGILWPAPTVSFWHLIEGLRSQPRFTPEQARQLAGDYLERLAGESAETAAGLAKIAAELEEPFELTEQLSMQDLLDLRELVKALFDDPDLDIERPYTTDEGETITIRDPHLAPSWLQEIFYFVPVAIALQLQRAGQYLAALDWYQTVYAYQFAAGERKIYHGLELESVFSDRPRLTPDRWLREDLNPHVFGRQRKHAYTRFTIQSIAQCLLDFADSEFTSETAESLPRARALYLTALDLLDLSEMPASNPVIGSLRRQAGANLNKLRSGRNIAGMERPPERATQRDASGARTNLPVIGSGGQLVIGESVPSQPTSYRYAVLIERAKGLVSIAQQMEAAFLSALEKRDAEAYTLLQASQDLQLSKARVQLQELRVSEAEVGVTLANLQKNRAEIQSGTFQEFINAGLNEWERAMIKKYQEARDAKQEAARLQIMAGSIKSWLGGDFLGTILNIQGLGAGLDALEAQTAAQMASVRASNERRRQEWQLQKNLADKDIEIADQQISLALTQKALVEQEELIASQEAEHAEATVDFLANKFTNADLYEWMSGILGSVYNFFLQQATAVAQLAQNQLAFERQEPPPRFIQSGYWQPSAETEASAGGNGQAPDRRGLTGSARLLQDIFKLDQHAFETNKRKLQLSQTFSLAQLFPFEFQQFREAGVLTFATPMEFFDRDFPGHYLRLIKRVRTSVIALLPPTRGIRATLTASGVSRVIAGRDVFQTTVVRREPELIAFTSPADATGLLELEPEGEMLLPFEARGVDTTWELEMPKAANPFDYSTIADVLLTIEYTALHSYDYRQQVIQGFDPSVSSERSFSLRDSFPDQWYALHNPEQVDEQQRMMVRFKTERADFPPNVEELKTEHLLLYFARADGARFEVPVAHLHFTLRGGDGEVLGGGATTIDGVISTRRANGASWVSLTGKSPVGEWELALPQEVRDRFEDEQIEDIIFVVSYSGQTPAWPQ